MVENREGRGEGAVDLPEPWVEREFLHQTEVGQHQADAETGRRAAGEHEEHVRKGQGGGGTSASIQHVLRHFEVKTTR